MSGPTLDVRLDHRLDGFTLDVSWSMGNELTVLFGCSGAGKSMTLEMIAGLATPHGGSVAIGGRVLFDARSRVNVPAHLRRVGYVFQQCALFPHMTVRGNIEYALCGARRPRALANEAMETLGIDALSGRYPREISGGQSQRVALARALAGRPGVLLLDEPFTALDAPVRLRMRRLLKDIRREFPIPMVMVTHDLQEALSLADRLIVYDAGSVVAEGPASEVMRSAGVSRGAVRDLLYPEAAAEDLVVTA